MEVTCLKDNYTIQDLTNPEIFEMQRSWILNLEKYFQRQHDRMLVTLVRDHAMKKEVNVPLATLTVQLFEGCTLVSPVMSNKLCARYVQDRLKTNQVYYLTDKGILKV